MTSSPRQLDQFYTHPDVAKHCADIFFSYLKANHITPSWWLEPSVGTGAFWNQFPENSRRMAIDLSPWPGAPAETISQDFLTWKPDPSLFLQQGAVMGNPPFGKNASLAVQFFNHAASLPIDHMAWVLPRTFSKHLFQNRLSRMFDLVQESILEPQSFIFENEAYAVPTVFQIWKRRKNGLRPLHKDLKTHPHFHFLNKQKALSRPHAFSFQRVGVKAGLLSKNFKEKAEASHYFIEPTHHKTFDILQNIDWNIVKHCTAGNPSIGKGELIRLYISSCASCSPPSS